MKKLLCLLVVFLIPSGIFAQEQKCVELLDEFHKSEMKKWDQFFDKLKKGDVDAVLPATDFKQLEEIHRICEEEDRVLREQAEAARKEAEKSISEFCRLRITEGSTDLCKGIPPDPNLLKIAHDLCRVWQGAKPAFCSKLIPLPK